MMRTLRNNLLGIGIGWTGALLVLVSFLRLTWMMEQSWTEYLGEARLPVDLNPICAEPQSHQVDVRIDGDYEVADDGLPIVSVYAVMSSGAGQPPTLVRSCLIPLPYVRKYTARTCDPYRFGTYGVRNGTCQVWIDGELQLGCAGWVMPAGMNAVLPPEPIPAAILPGTVLYLVLVGALLGATTPSRASMIE